MLNQIFDEKRKLIIGLTLLLAVGFAVTSLASYFASRHSIRHEIVTNELPLTTDTIYTEIQKDLIRPVFVSSMMARDTFLRDWTIDGERDTGKITRYLKEIQQEYGAVTSFFVSEKSRAYYYEDGILKHVSAQDPVDAWYFRVRKMSEPYEMNLDADEAHQNALTLFVNYRVMNYRNELLGVTGVGLPLNEVRDLIEQYQTRFHRTVYMTDRQGRIILHSRSMQEHDIHAIPGLGDQAAVILQQPQGAYDYVRDGRTHLLNARFIPELNWYLFVEKIEDEAYVAIFRTLLVNLGICVAITTIVALLTSLGIGRHQTRLKQAVETHTAEIRAALMETHAANRAKTQMLAYIGHDLRVPLVNISHYLQRLTTDGSEHALRYQATIEQSVDQQMQLIDELIEYARGELDHLELLPVPNYLFSFLQDVASQGELLATPNQNRFSLNVGNEIPPVLVFDAKRLRQVLLNLLSNATKFTSNGDIRLYLSFLPEPTVGRTRLRFEVKDTGAGIPKQDQQRIFLPFERRESEHQGSGLGLTIAHQIVGKMGGQLQVESVLGHGSTFSFDLCLDIAQESEVLPPKLAFPLPEIFGIDRRLLLLENHPGSTDHLYEALLLAGFDVERTVDGDAALALAVDRAFDVVLLDRTLCGPSDNVWTLARQLHALHPIHPPVIVLISATPPRRPENYPQDINIVASLLKPVTPEMLLRTLQSALAAKTSP